MKKYILLFTILISTQAQAQWGGWSRLWTYSGNTTSPARTTDTTQVFQMRFGTSTTAGFVPVADARGVLTMQSVAGAGAGDITAVTAGEGLGGGGTTGAVTLNALFTDGIKSSSDSLRILLRTLSGLLINSGAGAVDSLAVDTTSVFVQTKTENNTLYGQLAQQNAWTASNTFQATSGVVFLPYGAAAGATTNLRFRELSANGTNYFGWKAPDAIAANAVYVMPRPGSAGLPLLYGATDTTYFGEIKEAAMNWAQQNADSVTSRVSAATVSAQGKWYLLPIQVAVDSASALTADTTWFWQNLTGASLTVDSIHVASSTDDYAISIVKKNYSGGGGALVDAVTASTNGTNIFYITETTITSATITNGQRIGFKRPASTGNRVYIRIHYH